MDELASAFTDFETRLDDLPAVATEVRIKPDWRQAMVVYGPAAIASLANSRAIIVDREPATPAMMAPIIWCCGRPDKERDTRWVGRSLFGVLVHHDSLAAETLRWMLTRPEWILRATAIESLRTGHPAWLSEELLVQGLADRHRFVRSMAVHMISACHRNDLLPYLREAASIEKLDWLRESMESRIVAHEHRERSSSQITPTPPWLQFRDRPMGYLFMNRLEGPDVVQVLKARHGETGDGNWPPLQ
ncbi:MAG: HEAT repeat domain-containing protein [Phycisphaera sp.]|nr:MAG: HEAT repeat domain-containing protein [Phycisphaera sp.]